MCLDSGHVSGIWAPHSSLKSEAVINYSGTWV